LVGLALRAMRRRLGLRFWGGLAIALILVGVAVVFLVNRFRWVPQRSQAELRGSAAVSGSVRVRADIRIASWNIGYAGMGAASDFVADGGQQLRPLEPKLVHENLRGIIQSVQTIGADVYLLQEAAGPSWFNYRVDVLGALVDALPGYIWCFGGDFATVLIPPPWSTCIGNAIFARFAPAEAYRLRLPLEPTYVAGTFRKLYRMHIMRFPIEGSNQGLTVINVHLAAFDEDAATRLEQLRRVLEHAADLYRRGDAVVIGGDFNLRLANSEFPNNTDKKHLFWIHDLPADALPEGWILAADPKVPTNRTAYKAYVAGENYVSVIDGFVCSPDVQVHGVRTIDLGFEHSDHHPVVLQMRLLPRDTSAVPASSPKR
jgi:endonuclease/exonuclease/phosphatase family metal-dependent hydrolase